MTRIAFLDDSEDFLYLIEQHFIGGSHYEGSSVFYTSPSALLNYLNKEDDLGSLDPSQRISLIFVDYSMPQMDGLEFCSQIKNPNIKKILLTGEADNETMLQHADKKLIDAIIGKGDIDLRTTILDTIEKHQKTLIDPRDTA